jgi:nitrous oxidase accessory protein NosD
VEWWGGYRKFYLGNYGLTKFVVASDGTGDYLTINDGLAAAGVGQTIRVKPGTYYETGENAAIDLLAGQTLEAYDPANPPTIAAPIGSDGSKSVVHLTSGQTLRNLKLRGNASWFTKSTQFGGSNVITTSNGTGEILIEGCEIYEGSNSGLTIGLDAGTKFTIKNCNIHHNGSYGTDHGLYLYNNGPVTLEDVKIESNFVHHNFGYGLHFYPTQDHYAIRDNLVVHNGLGVAIIGDSNLFEYNTVANNELGGVLWWGGHSTFRNNIFWGSPYPAAETWNYSDLNPQAEAHDNMFTDNCYRYIGYHYSDIQHSDQTSIGATDIRVDPLFVSSDPQEIADFRLQAGSPAAGMGFRW